MEENNVDKYIRVKGEELIQKLQSHPNKSIVLVDSTFKNINRLIQAPTKDDFLVERPFIGPVPGITYAECMSILSYWPRVVDSMDFGVEGEKTRAREVVVQNLMLDIINGNVVEMSDDADGAVRNIEAAILQALDDVINHFGINYEPQTTEQLFANVQFPEPTVDHTEKYEMRSDPSPSCLLLEAGQKISRLELIKRVLHHNRFMGLAFPRFGLCAIQLNRLADGTIIKHCSRYNEMSAPDFLDMADFIIVGRPADLIGLEREVIETFQEFGTAINDLHDFNKGADSGDATFLGIYSINRQNQLSMLDIMTRKFMVQEPSVVSRAARYVFLLRGRNDGYICHRSGGYLMKNVAIPSLHHAHRIGEMSHKRHMTKEETLNLIAVYKTLCGVDDLEDELGQTHAISHHLWKTTIEAAYPGFYLIANSLTSTMFSQRQSLPLLISLNKPIVQSKINRMIMDIEGDSSFLALKPADYKTMMQLIFSSKKFIESL